MHPTTKLLSDVTVFAKYARYEKSRGKRESWTRLVDRNKAMHLKMYAHIESAAALIEEAYELVYAKKVLPSMRSLQFSGRPIELAHNRIYNCAYLPIDHPDAFSELMFLLLGGTGGGYSVQKRHVYQLPVVAGPNGKDRRYVVGDSIEGWSDAIKIVVEAYFYNKHLPRFDYSDIRAKGAELIKTGGKAPGPAPLEACVKKIESILKQAVGRKLYPIDGLLFCHTQHAVNTSGII
jgi:ribonucleoside-diphosphate reductase alpha chain